MHYAFLKDKCTTLNLENNCYATRTDFDRYNITYVIRSPHSRFISVCCQSNNRIENGVVSLFYNIWQVVIKYFHWTFTSIEGGLYEFQTPCINNKYGTSHYLDKFIASSVNYTIASWNSQITSSHYHRHSLESVVFNLYQLFNRALKENWRNFWQVKTWSKYQYFIFKKMKYKCSVHERKADSSKIDCFRKNRGTERSLHVY